jgi:hypothetical protein
MENREAITYKPTYKILARFLAEVYHHFKSGNNVFPVLMDFPSYYRYNREKKRTIDLKLPWIAHRAMLRLKEILRNDMSVVEFGSGGSTLFLQHHVAKLTSIEHDKEWADLVSIKIANDQNKKICYIPPDKECLEEEFKSEYGMHYSGKCFKAYCLKALEFPDESLDLVIIDGRARSACLRYSHTKVKPGGYLLFDNSDRSGYQSAISEYLKGWKREDFNGVTISDAFFNSTSLFRKPILISN